MDSTAPVRAEALPPEIYQLNAPFREVEFMVQGGRVKVAHRLLKPKFHQLKDRESKIKNEAITVSKDEIRSVYSEREANAWLWDEIVTHIKGYDIGDGDIDGWREVEMLKRAIPNAHKIAAVEKLYAISARLPEVKEEEEPGGFRLVGASDVEVILEIGAEKDPDFVIYHRLRMPGESEWNKYLMSNSEVREVKTPGSRDKQRRVKVLKNIRADVELYDLIFQDIRGAQVRGSDYTPEKRDLFLPEIDALHKQVVVQALGESFQIELGN
jgi:hypothetical protein